MEGILWTSLYSGGILGMIVIVQVKIRWYIMKNSLV